MTKRERDELTDLLVPAMGDSPLPWADHGENLGQYRHGITDRKYQWVATTGDPSTDAREPRDHANAALIVAAVNALPKLLAIAEAAEAVLRRINESGDDMFAAYREVTDLAALLEEP